MMSHEPNSSSIVDAEVNTTQETNSTGNDALRHETPFVARLVEPEQPLVTGNARLLQQKWVVLMILFFVTGFLGIPLLWTNQQFGRTERIVWSIIVTVYTLGLIAFVGAVCYWSYLQIIGV